MQPLALPSIWFHYFAYFYYVSIFLWVLLFTRTCDWLITFPTKENENVVREYEFWSLVRGRVRISMVVIVTPAILVRQAFDTITRQKWLRNVRTSWSISGFRYSLLTSASNVSHATEFGMGRLNGVAEKFARFRRHTQRIIKFNFTNCVSESALDGSGRTKWCTH